MVETSGRPLVAGTGGFFARLIEGYAIRSRVNVLSCKRAFLWPALFRESVEANGLRKFGIVLIEHSLCDGYALGSIDQLRQLTKLVERTICVLRHSAPVRDRR
jgi:hypothetical protein